MMKIIIHIGLHKTGTTFLQREVFPKILKGNNYLRKSEAKKAIKNKKFDLRKINFLSEENFSNSIIKPETGWQNFSDFVEQLNRIKNSESNADIKIILILRNHTDYLWSAYLHELKMCRKQSISFEEYARSFGEKGLSWSERINALSEFDLMVIDYNELLTDSVGLIQKILNFVGLEILDMPNFKSIKQNLTPKTQPALVACQNFEKMYQSFNYFIKKVTGYSLPFEYTREKMRDKIIFSAAALNPNASKLSKPELPPDLKNKFRLDWEQAWLTVNEHYRKSSNQK